MTAPQPTALLARLAAPTDRLNARASWLSVLAALIWPAQAAVVAIAIAGLLGPAGVLLSPLMAAVAFFALHLLRTLLEAAAQKAAQAAAIALVSTVRERLIATALTQRIGSNALPSAELAALVAEKAALLGPWAARFRPAMVRSRVVPLVYLVLAFTQSWLAALILVIAGPLIPVFMALVGMAAESASRAQLREIGSLSRLAIDRIAAITDLRLLGASTRAQDDLAQAAENLRGRTMAVLRIAFLSSTVLELFSALGVALVAVYVGFSLIGEIPFGGWSGALSPASGIFLLMIAPEFFQPLRDLAAAWHDRAGALAVAAELNQAEAAIETSGSILGRGEPAQRLDPAPLIWQGLKVAPGAGTAALTLPDGQIAPGEAVALTGVSGAGKTTLLCALAGLTRPQSGEIRWGATVLDDTTADAIRAGMAWIAQLPRFPDAPLAAAIALGRDGDMQAALRAAHAYEIVTALPGGLEARLGDFGGGISGGEARRLAVARAHLAQPMLVLADEPTADLDPETARAVTEGLLSLRARGAALLIATHDPALITAMDRTIRLPAEAHG